MKAPIPERCDVCDAKLKSVTTRQPIGEPIAGAPISDPEAGLGTGSIDGAIRSKLPIPE